MDEAVCAITNGWFGHTRAMICGDMGDMWASEEGRARAYDVLLTIKMSATLAVIFAVILSICKFQKMVINRRKIDGY